MNLVALGAIQLIPASDGSIAISVNQAIAVLVNALQTAMIVTTVVKCQVQKKALSVKNGHRNRLMGTAVHQLTIQMRDLVITITAVTLTMNLVALGAILSIPASDGSIAMSVNQAEVVLVLLRKSTKPNHLDS